MLAEKDELVPPSNGIERLEAEAGPHIGDDTIELALTDEDMLALSRAAEEEHVKTSPGRSAVIGTGAFRSNQSVRSRIWPPELALLLLGIVISVALEVVAHRTSTVTITAPSDAERSAKSPDSPARFSNPFDASEVFEFPPGTSDEQARQSVATILLQRARDRQVAAAEKGNRPMAGAAADRARLARTSEPRRT
jgi:hypothetical protein